MVKWIGFLKEFVLCVTQVVLGVFLCFYQTDVFHQPITVFFSFFKMCVFIYIYNFFSSMANLELHNRNANIQGTNSIKLPFDTSQLIYMN